MESHRAQSAIDTRRRQRVGPSERRAASAPVVKLDHWRAARSAVRRHGHAAPERALARASSASLDGDAEGIRIWMSVAEIAEHLLSRQGMGQAR